ncbi:hypothetical protein ASD39_17980 [Sphingomonas sp. Root50]|nr:hypothetical protein ASD17_20865 [Sphingomonas sp. Root1294]KQY72681.1 hypothetical protein ASD39_17980 [Sphingomonas sp. Root50]KRB87692.1 hypothetical protein ASE22_23595 [Sphingomonas sp. Root720]
MEMPISDDTAALVAAQLTLAATTRMGAPDQDGRMSPKDREQEIANIYERNLAKVRAIHE